MPAVSRKQRIAIAIGEHHPEELYPRNKGILSMSHQQMHDFAATPEKGLPESAPKTPKKRGLKNIKLGGF
jgi:hypothetical protein